MNNKQITMGIMYTFQPDDQDHVVVRIIPTGWADQYHVIIEDAVHGAKTFPEPLYKLDIETRYGIKLPCGFLHLNKLIEDNPKDVDLGGAIRQQIQLLD
jgi:hypothetical protein